MSLYNDIVNIPCPDADISIDEMIAYKMGHSFARHSAAELAIEADKTIEELRSALQKIADIKHVMFGGDWQEIEEAQEIAKAALQRTL